MSLFFFCELLQCRYQQLGYWFWCGLGRGQVPDHVVRLTYPAGSQQDGDHIEKCLYFSVLILYHALPCSWESLEEPWWHFSSAGHEIHSFVNVLKWSQESVYKKLKLPCSVDHGQESCLGEGKNTLFPDMWESTWIVQVLNCCRICCLLQDQGGWTRVSLLKGLRYFTKWTYISLYLWSVRTSPFWRG